MSYDLQVWSTDPINPALALPDMAEWQSQENLLVCPQRGWQIVIGPYHRVEFEDVPEGVNAALSGVQHMTELNLEPIGAPRTAHALLRRIAKALAKSAHGVVVDVQSNTIVTPTGVQRFMASSSSDVLDVLELSWFSADNSVRSQVWLREFVLCLERYLPEALPVRYGRFEPPPYRYRETGSEHLIAFLAERYLAPSHIGYAVWYPKRPVLHLHLTLSAGPSRLGWRSHRITIDVEASVLEQPGWSTALNRLWRRLAHLFRVFYADVRTLRNHGRHGMNAYEMMASDRHPVCGWFWAGMPRQGGHAVALGAPYLTLWPDLQKIGEQEGDIVFLSDKDWTRSHDVFARVGMVPEALAVQSPAYAPDRPGPNGRRVYPSVWPFGKTHDDSP